MQEMSLDYHFKVGQEVGSATHAFFGFNGKATCIQHESSVTLPRQKKILLLCDFTVTVDGNSVISSSSRVDLISDI